MSRAVLSSLPPSLAPRGLSRVQASEYIGVGVTKFDEMVGDGRMPKPKRIDEFIIWDRFQLEDVRASIGTVYILGFDHYVKIGFTRNLQQRKYEIQSGVPRKLHIYTSFPGSFVDEKELHKHLRKALIERNRFAADWDKQFQKSKKNEWDDL